MAKPRAYERIVRDMKARIADGRFVVGQRLPTERDLAQSYGVSRPTVREAVRALVLEGVLSARRGSGVSVIARPIAGPRADQFETRAFELLEARIAIEGEAAWLAASRISEGQLKELDGFVGELETTQGHSGLPLEADRKFHLLVAAASMNGVVLAAVRTLWEARVSPPPPLGDPATARRIRVAEHRAIASALRGRDPVAARSAMRSHLERSARSLIAAIEAREVTEVRAKVADTYGRFVLTVSDINSAATNGSNQNS